MTNNEAAKWIQLYIDLAKIDPLTGEAAHLNNDDRKMIEAMEMAINALTTQPETHDKRTETHECDCISRADVEQTVEDNILCYTHSDRPIDQDPDTECHMAIRTALRMLRKDLRKLPSAQPEIIHCRDCKWSDWYTSVDGKRYCYCMETGNGGRTEDDFCSRAERRKE